jgi:hexosaminidase
MNTLRGVVMGLALFSMVAAGSGRAGQGAAESAPGPALLPLPASLEMGTGVFHAGPGTAVEVAAGDAEARHIAGLLSGYVARAGGPRLVVRTLAGSADGAIVLAIDPQAAGAGDEGYELSVSPRQIRVAARNPAGLFYGAVTLWQLLTPRDGGASMEVPALHIVDTPRFAWRGLMLDSARHYMPPQFIEQLLDWMALHKLNTFHWHLTDDQGWRLQIHKYPRLTTVGAHRKDIDRSGNADGYYTQEQVRAIVRYAAARHITVVPEIDMPGHMQAAIAAYPWLGSHGDRPPVSADWGVHAYLLNPGERTFGFVEDVLTEVMALFPGSYIHVGGDEAIKDQWQGSPEIQQRMHALGIANENAMQGYFEQRIEKFLEQHGRKLLGWDEIVDDGLPPNATVMSWRGTNGAIAASRAGHDVVMAPYQSLYLDYLQGDGHDEPPGRPEPLITLRDVYDFQPVPSQLDAEEARHILGLQANVWTEHIASPALVEHAVFPRLAALAERAWSPADAKDWPDFLRRLTPQLLRYRAMGIAYANSAFAVKIAVKPAGPGKAMATLSSQTGYGEIHYTVDGTEPTPDSPRYQAALDLSLPAELRAASFADQQALSGVARQRIDAASLLQRNSDQLSNCSDKLPLRLGGPRRADGSQPVYRVDVMDPCWIAAALPLDGIGAITLRLASLPYNFQLGHDAKDVARHPTSHGGYEFQVHLDSCDGPLLATVPLPSGLTPRPPQDFQVPLQPQSGGHDLCLYAAGPFPNPLWVIDSLQLVPAR